LNKTITPARGPRDIPHPFALPIARALGIIVLLVVCCFSWWRLLLSHHVNTQLARIRAAGYPVSGAELNAWRPVPDAENGALIVTQAFALLRIFPDGRSNEVRQITINRTNQWSPATRELAETYVQTNAPALAKVRESLLLSRFRYPVDFSYGPNTDLRHLSKLRDLARIASMAAAFDAEARRADQWPEEVELQLKLAGSLDDEPSLISHLVRKAIIGMAVRTAERSLNSVSASEGACKRLEAAFTHAGETNLLPLALAGERAMTIPIFRMSWKEMQVWGQDEGPESPPREPQHFSGKPALFLSLTGFEERDLNFYLQTMDEGISLAAFAPPASLTFANDLESARSVAGKRVYFLSGLLLPYLPKVFVREATMQADIRLATTALAVERFRLARGRLPEGLRELAPQFLEAVPTDPFDGAPPRYRQLTRGYIIYSVDTDGHDDGGREPPERRESGDKTGYDITFIVER